MMSAIFVLLISIIRVHYCVEVHFETAESGFFLKHSRQPSVGSDIIQSSYSTLVKPKTSYDSVLSIDRFTVVQTTQPVSIRASYGPFSTKQTVPARFIVPEVLDGQNDNNNNTTAALIELQQSNTHLDISAHLIKPSVSQDSPVLRVLFHTGTDPGNHLQRRKICILLHVSMANEVPLKGSCVPEGEDGVCLAEVIVPLNWWPRLQYSYMNNSGVLHKHPQRNVQVSYSVFEPSERSAEQCEPRIQIQPLTAFTQVLLVPPFYPLKELRADDLFTILVPQAPLYPMSKINVLVYLNDQSISAFTVRIRIKSGIKILGATLANDLWNISVEKENSKHTTARVTALKKEADINATNNNMRNGTKNTSGGEIFYWLLQIDDGSTEVSVDRRIIWSVTYYSTANVKTILNETLPTDEIKRKLITKLEVNKDDIQAVIPMAKKWELMNTAILTGRQVSQAMKVFIVSQAGKVADVTLQSSCHAEDESVIKVSSSCSSVYIDGSEIRGSSNASIIVKYGMYTGLAKFTVWMPEFPLEVYIPDFRLSQIKGWKVVDENHILQNKQMNRRKKRSYIWGHYNTGYFHNGGADKVNCRTRYQQSPVEVYARFLAIDQNSGRISYFISRRTGLRVTDLVQPLLRVADPKIASLKGRILQGKSVGRTDIQVLSPITGRVIGTKEIRVGSDKVSLTKLYIRVISGLQLIINPDNTIDNGYIAETSVTHKLTAQYQEGLLDIDLQFSDGTKTPLRDIAVDDYFLLVESLDTEVVAFAPMLASHHPRVIAVGEGNGDLLRITLLLSEDCRMRRSSLSAKQSKSNSAPLISALAAVEVNFNSIDNGNKQEYVQNDEIFGRDRTISRNSADLADIIVGIPMKDAQKNNEQAKLHRGSIKKIDTYRRTKYNISNYMTSMEIGVYVLLLAFCFAIVVFVISCIVYASKFKPIFNETGPMPMDVNKRNFNINILQRESEFPNESTTNVHDWVWLGRSTMDKTSIKKSASPKVVLNDTRDPGMRITSNPIISFSNASVTSFKVHKKGMKGFNPHSQSACETERWINQSGCTNKSAEYRPPIPPHRNIVERRPVNSEPKIYFNQYNALKSSNDREDCQNKSTSDLHLESNEPSEETRTVYNHHSEEKIEPSSHRTIANSKETHNAEKLVEIGDHCKKTAFRFDTLTQNNTKKGDTDESHTFVQPTKPKNLCEDYSSGYIPAPKLALRVNRCAVTGKPMLSAFSDGCVDNSESLILDDIYMNYEQIMDYFDNLKESNA